jgi:hypothetical protein
MADPGQHNKYISPDDIFEIIVTEITLNDLSNPPMHLHALRPDENAISNLKPTDYRTLPEKEKHITRRDLKNRILSEILGDVELYVNSDVWAMIIGPCYPYRADRCYKTFFFDDVVRNQEIVLKHRYQTHVQQMLEFEAEPGMAEPESLYKWIGMNKWHAKGENEIVHIYIINDVYGDLVPTNSPETPSSRKEELLVGLVKKYVELMTAASDVVGRFEYGSPGDTGIEEGIAKRDVVGDFLGSYGVSEKDADTILTQMASKSIYGAIDYVYAHYDYGIDFQYPVNGLQSYSDHYFSDLISLYEPDERVRDDTRQGGGDYERYRLQYMRAKIHYLHLR